MAKSQATLHAFKRWLICRPARHKISFLYVCGVDDTRPIYQAETDLNIYMCWALRTCRHRVNPLFSLPSNPWNWTPRKNIFVSAESWKIYDGRNCTGGVCVWDWNALCYGAWDASFDSCAKSAVCDICAREMFSNGALQYVLLFCVTSLLNSVMSHFTRKELVISTCQVRLFNIKFM